MKLEEIKEIKIIHSETDVNSKLKGGYKIQKIIQSRSNGDEISPCFIMAK